MRALHALAALLLALTAAGCAMGMAQAGGAGTPADPPAETQPATQQPEIPQTEAVGPPAPAHSRAIGKPWAGRLVNGVIFPAEGIDHFTWDPVLKRSPDRSWRRHATDTTVRRVLETLAAFREAHPESPPIGVGDLSRPNGGEFGRRFGGLGHASHQNGLDVDVYYPRRDGLLRAPRRPGHVDRRLAQALVNAFLRAGARKIFTGPSLALRGPRNVVIPLVHHDDHLHARFGP